VQGTAEGNTFSRAELDALLDLAEGGVATIAEAQRAVLADAPAPRTPGR
jgi:ribonuclease PH